MSQVLAAPDGSRTTARQAPTAAGRREAEFVEFVHARSPSLLRAAYLLAGDQQHAEDLVQDALARTYRAWSRLERQGNAAAYARKIMYHLQVSWWRRRRVAEKLVGDDLPVVSQPPRDVAAELTLHAALLRLPAGQRAAIVLRYFEDLTETETARTLGCSQSSVKTRTRRGLEKLRRLAPELEGILR